MVRKSIPILALGIVGAAGLAFTIHQAALACGGFFRTNSPVDQNAERIIFTQNRDGICERRGRTLRIRCHRVQGSRGGCELA